MVLLLLVALSYVGIVLVILLAVLFCGVHCYSYGLCCSCDLCHSCWLGICRISVCISIDGGLILICGHSYNRTVMVWTKRVEYNGHVVIVIGVNIGRILQRVYVIVPDSIAVIVFIVAILIIFARDIVLIGVIIFWFVVRDFML